MEATENYNGIAEKSLTGGTTNADNITTYQVNGGQQSAAPAAVEVPQGGTATVSVLNENPVGDLQISKIIPAHLEFQITFNTLMWSQLDDMDRTFSAIDSENLTWKQLDTRTE